VTEKRAALAPEIASIPRAFGSHCQFLADGSGRILTLSMVTHFSGFMTGRPRTDEKLAWAFAVPTTGFASARGPSGQVFRTGSIQKAGGGSGGFLNGTQLSLTGYFCRKGGSHEAPSSETHNLFG
jgi:hypothetical protein